MRPLPRGMSVNWPTPPLTTGDEVLIDSEANFRDRYINRIDKSRTRFHFSTNINEAIVVENTSDIEIIIDPGFKLRNIELRRPVQRVKISGGEVGRIRARVYDSINDDSGYITDVLIDNIMLDNRDGESWLCPEDIHDCDGVTFQGVHRAAVINSTINSLVYPVTAWKPTSTLSIPVQNQDIVIANNDLHSTGYTRGSTRVSEATVRMHDSLRTVTMHNRLQNGPDGSGDGKHNYRIHGFPDDRFPDEDGARYAYAACNVFENSGAMIGKDGGAVAGATEKVSHHWFNSNQFHQRAPSLYEMGFSSTDTSVPHVREVEIRGNHAYSIVEWHLAPPCFYCPSTMVPDWVIRDNIVERLRE